MKLLEVIEETAAEQRLGAQIIASKALVLLADKLKLPDGIIRSYDTKEGREPERFKQIWETCFPLTRDLGLSISEFSAQFLEDVTAKLAASVIAAMPVGAKLFECRALQMPMGLDMSCQVCSPPDGLGLRFIRAYDIHVDSFLSRFDIQFRFE